MDVLRIILQIIVSAAALYALILIISHITLNALHIKQSSELSRNGKTVSATVTEIKPMLERINNSKYPSSITNYLLLEYSVDGIKYTHEAELRDSGGQIQAGDMLEIAYDENKPENAVLLNGSEAESSKNLIKMDIAYLICVLTVWMLVFFTIGTKH